MCTEAYVFLLSFLNVDTISIQINNVNENTKDKNFDWCWSYGNHATLPSGHIVGNGLLPTAIIDGVKAWNQTTIAFTKPITVGPLLSSSQQTIVYPLHELFIWYYIWGQTFMRPWPFDDTKIRYHTLRKEVLKSVDGQIKARSGTWMFEPAKQLGRARHR